MPCGCYFFAYKKSIFSADQRERVLHNYRLIYYIIRSILQIAVLLITKNFLLYICCNILCTFLENFTVSWYSTKEYTFLVDYKNETLTKAEKKPIFDNIKALFIYKIGSTILDGTDNIIISAFNGVVSVGLLSNYTLLTNAVLSLLSQVSTSITSSVGNFIVKNDDKERENLLDKVTFVHYIIYGFAFVVLFSVLNPFIAVWAGKDYLLEQKVVFVHCLNSYIFGMMNSIWVFRTTMGLFKYGKWRPAVSAVINLAVSIWWANSFGVIGVLLGTTFTRVVTNVWYDPYIVYKYGLKKNPFRYYAKWLLYAEVSFVDIGIIILINSFVNYSGIINIVFNAAIAVAVFVVSTVICFGKTKEFYYLITVGRGLLRKIKK